MRPGQVQKIAPKLEINLKLKTPIYNKNLNM